MVTRPRCWPGWPPAWLASTSGRTWPGRRRTLTAQGVGNVVILTGDGTQGAQDFAPSDAIVVCAAYPRVPPPLAAQLKIGGRLVQPVGPGGAEHAVLYHKEQDSLRLVRIVTAASFVQLYGRHGFPHLHDHGHPASS